MMRNLLCTTTLQLFHHNKLKKMEKIELEVFPLQLLKFSNSVCLRKH